MLLGPPEPPDIDWKKLEKEFNTEAEKAARDFQKAIENAFKEKANDLLDKSRVKYLEGLSFSTNIEADSVIATVSGWLPVAVEEGAQAFDMKPGLLKGRRSRVIPLHTGELRTVSINSRPESWWHPGIQARAISFQVKNMEKALHSETVGKFL